MNKKYFVKASIIALTFMFAIGLVLPAQAFYMEVPQSLKNLQNYKKPQPGGVVLTQMPLPGGEGTSAPPPGGTYQPPSGSTYTPPPNGNYQQQPNQQPINNYQMQEPPQNQQQFGPGGGCAPGTTCEGNQSGQFGPGGGGQGQMGPGGEGQFGPGQGQQGPSEEQQKQQQERQMKDMKRGIRQMESGIKQLEKMFAQAEKKGTVIPQEIKDKLQKAKDIISALTTATTPEEIQNAGMEEFGNLMQELDEARRTLIEDGQRVQDMKRNMKNMNKGLQMFEKQIAQLTKQGVAVPSDISENLNKIKTIVAAVNAAKTWDEMMAAGIDELQDLMQTLDQSRQQLEMLTRWPQTLKQLDRELKQLTAALKRSKTIVNSLLKKGIDLNSVYSDFEAAVNKLKSVRDEAAAKMKAGESEAAFDLLENDFFGQMEDIWEFQKTIDIMSNLGRFASEFKQGLAQSQQTINRLKRQKIDTAELQDLLEQAKVKGNDVLALLKIKPIDEEAIMAGMEELWNLKQEFENKVGELTGQEEAMPWEQGPQQFQGLSMPSGIQKMIPQKSVEQPPQNEMAPGTSGGGGGGNYVAP